MKGKLIKLNLGPGYRLNDEDGNLFGSTLAFSKTKLSKQNCDEIFGVVDVDKLAEENTEEFIEVFDYNDGRGNICRFNNSHQVQESYIKGFNKAMELNKDKLFTIEDMGKLWDFCINNKSSFWECLESIQQPTEIEVEIEMEMTPVWGDKSDMRVTYIPKLDSASCLILKKI